MSVSMARAVTIAINVGFNGQGGHDSHVGFDGQYGHDSYNGFNGQ